MKPSHLLTSAQHWCKFAPARDLGDEPVGVWSPQAVKWDLIGAVARYTGLPTSQSEHRIRQTQAWHIWCEDNARAEYKSQQTLADFNDTVRFDWVALALKQANL